jgi:hypothetical protein
VCHALIELGKNLNLQECTIIVGVLQK